MKTFASGLALTSGLALMGAASLGLPAYASDSTETRVEAPLTIAAPDRPTPEQARETALSLWLDDDLIHHPKGSCAGCHGPDFIDLAFIGSEDAEITRRALIDGATEDEAEALVLAVNDMRAELGLPQRDARSFRPFQPGGAVLLPDLPDTPYIAAVKRDIAFGEQMEAMLPTLFGPPIETLEDAQIAREEMLDLLNGTNYRGHNPRSLDLRALPVGVVYPLWSADLHHGAGEGTMNDWIADMAHDAKAGEREAWKSQIQAYLDKPDEENFWRLYRAAETKTEAAALADCTYPKRNAHLACGATDDFSRNKFQSALIGQHMMREAASPHPSTFLRGPLAFSYTQEEPRLDFMLNRKKIEHLPAPSWEVGDRARVMLDKSKTQGSLRTLLGQVGLPGFVQDSVDADRTSKTEQQALRLSWFWIGFTMDPSFARIHSSNSTKSGEYMVESLLHENMHLHNAFAAHTRIVAKGTLQEANVKRQGRNRYPVLVPPVFKLNYSYFVGYKREKLKWNQNKKAGKIVPQELKDEQAALWTRFNGNAFRMGMHLYLDDISEGAAPSKVPLYALRSHFATYHADSAAADTALMDQVEAVAPAK
ncbi:MAG: hypothetical protein WBG08_10755 [Litorimonas sp.]